MREYRSRHQPRSSTAPIVKIGSAERYDRYYDITCDAIQNRMFPTIALPAGSLVARTNDPKYDARGIPSGSPMYPDNRFSGLRLDGRAGHGALYIGTLAGVLREHTHYSLPDYKKQPDKIWRPGSSDVTSEFMRGQRAGDDVHAKKKLFLFQVNETLQFADLRITAMTCFFHKVLQAGRQRYGFADNVIVDFLARSVSDPTDYSGARGIADAISDTGKRSGLAGVCAFSSRADKDNGFIVGAEEDRTGGLVHAVFGAGSAIVSALTPVPNPKREKIYKTPTDQDRFAFDNFAELSERIRPKSETDE